MSIEQPNQVENGQKVPSGSAEQAPATIDPAVMAQKRIANANTAMDNRQGKMEQVFLLSRQLTPEEKVEEKAEEKAADDFRTSYVDTKKVLYKRIQHYERLLTSEKEAWDRGDRTISNTQRNMIGTDLYKESKETVRTRDALKNLYQELDAMLFQPHRMDDLKKIRVQLGIPELPQSLVSDTNIFNELALKAAVDKDPSLSVNWDKIRAEFKQTELMLSQAETVLHILDTGVGIAAGFVPYGSEVYQLSRSLTHVAQGTMTPEDAARDFIVGVLASHVGGKVAEKLNVEKFVGAWVKKNTKFFTKEMAEKIAIVAAKTAAGAGRGSTTGATEGAMAGTYNVLRGTQTVEQAVDDTVNRALIGLLFGGVMGGGMEGWKIRGEKLNATQKDLLKNIIGTLPDTPEGRMQRVKAAENLLGRELTGDQGKGILAAHDIPMNEEHSISRKAYELREAGFTEEADRRTLIEYYVCGSSASATPAVPNMISNDVTQQKLALNKQRTANSQEIARLGSSGWNIALGLNSGKIKKLEAENKVLGDRMYALNRMAPAPIGQQPTVPEQPKQQAAATRAAETPKLKDVDAPPLKKKIVTPIDIAKSNMPVKQRWEDMRQRIGATDVPMHQDIANALTELGDDCPVITRVHFNDVESRSYDSNRNSNTRRFTHEYMELGNTAGRNYVVKNSKEISDHGPVMDNFFHYFQRKMEKIAPELSLSNSDKNLRNNKDEIVILNDGGKGYASGDIKFLTYSFKSTNYVDSSNSNRPRADFYITIPLPEKQAKELYVMLQKHPESARQFFFTMLNKPDLEYRDYIMDKRLPTFDNGGTESTYFWNELEGGKPEKVLSNEDAS